MADHGRARIRPRQRHQAQRLGGAGAGRQQAAPAARPRRLLPHAQRRRQLAVITGAMDFSNQTVLVVDQGLYVHIAEKLAESFGRVLYYCNGWRAAFPLSARYNVGAGIEGVQRVSNPWEYVDAADLIVFPDTYFGGE